MNILELMNELPRMELCSKPNARVLLRVDMNVPVRRETMEILDEYRIEAHVRTVKALLELNTAVVIMTHQGRPGDEEFVSLHRHAEAIRRYLNRDINFIEDVMGPAARDEVKKLRPGEVLLLDNVRFSSEEMLEGEPDKLAKTHMVMRLASLFDYFILDAFATAHRAQPSIVGFPYVLPSCMGLVMENEVYSLGKVLSSGGITLIAGGAKVPETLRAMRRLIEGSLVRSILVGGLVGQLIAGIRVGNGSLIRNAKASPSIFEEARELVNAAGSRLISPVDFVESGGDVASAAAARDAVDIGPRTVELFVDKLREGGIAVMTGPMGVVEVEEYSRGTREVMRSMVQYSDFSVIGGGHTIMAARRFGLISKVNHVSTGGRAFLQFMGGEELPGLRALVISRRKFWVH